MPRAATSLAEILGARHVVRGIAGSPKPAGRWSLDALRGGVAELRAAGAGAQLTAALLAVRDAQRGGEAAAWITSAASSFYPPDAARAGIDLGALIVVRLERREGIPRAADRLLRSGGVGIVVLDLVSCGGSAPLAPAQASRLAGLARRHGAAALLLAPGGGSGAGSLVSLGGEARRLRGGPLEIRALRDKRGGAPLRHVEPCRGPAGLR